MRTFNLTYVIEDDKITAAMVDYTLNNSKFFNQSVAFENGRIALEDIIKALESNAELPDLILLDLNMPIMDGWEFLDEITKYTELAEIPVVILTSSIINSDKEKAMSYKMVKGYLPKPLVEENIPLLLAVLH